MNTLMRMLALTLCLAASIPFIPFWASLVLAAWFADLLGPAVRWFEKFFHGRRTGAAAVVVLLALSVFLPFTAIIVMMISEGKDLLGQLRGALEGRESIGAALLQGGSPFPSVQEWTDLASKYGANAWRALMAILQASADAALALLLFVFGLYTFSVDGQRAYNWFKRHIPLPGESIDRLALAFRETGRGLIVAGGGTSLVQGAIATVAYMAIGIPRALLLGPLTGLCAIVPFVGTAIVWGPIAIQLMISGDHLRGGLLIITGLSVSVVDNFVRPVLARHGHLTLPTFVVLVSMLGGIAVFGPSGALLGPLLVRLAKESLEIIAGEPDNADESSPGK